MQVKTKGAVEYDKFYFRGFKKYKQSFVTKLNDNKNT